MGTFEANNNWNPNQIIESNYFTMTCWDFDIHIKYFLIKQHNLYVSEMKITQNNKEIRKKLTPILLEIKIVVKRGFCELIKFSVIIRFYCAIYIVTQL